MKKYSIFLFFVITLFPVNCKSIDLVEQNFQTAQNQYRKMLSLIGDSDALPKSADSNGKLISTEKIEDWIRGFFPGSLWYIYENTKDNFWKDAAIKQTNKLYPVQYFNGHHDVGFMMYCSYGNAYRLTGDKSYESILINSANSLCTRYYPSAGVIRSWDNNTSRNGEVWHCPVIIDNMMNLELLFFASKITGNNYYRDIAINHADNTLKNHLRPDNSCYHVVNYDTITGKVLWRGTHQGYADNSTWARGQAWGIYGFTIMYRETKNKKYLKAAEDMANLYLNHPNLPKDMIPYWDFNAPEIPHALRDASSAAITASALLELAQYSKEKNTYYTKAERMLQSLSKKYLSNKNTKHSFILNHSVGNLPNGKEVDVPLTYADYYFLEALLRFQKSKSL